MNVYAEKDWNPVGPDGLSPVWVVRGPLNTLVAKTFFEAAAFMDGVGTEEDDCAEDPAYAGRTWTVCLERWPMEKLTSLQEWSA